MSLIFKTKNMKNLFLILFVFVFSFCFSQSEKNDPKNQLLEMVNNQNNLVINSFNCDSSSLETIKLINKYRKSKGLSQLDVDSSLLTYAKEYSKYLSTSNQLKHSSIEQTTITAENLFNKSTFGMYIFKNGDFNGVPSECVTGWKNSDGHNKNMLIYNVTKIGIGTYISNTNGFRLNVVMVVR